MAWRRRRRGPLRRVTAAVISFLLVLLLLAVAGLVLTNRLLLPPLLGRAVLAVSAGCDCTVSVRRAVLRPFRGLVVERPAVEDLTVQQTDAPVRFEAQSAIIRIRPVTLLSLPAVVAGGGDPADLIPRRVTLRDAAVTFGHAPERRLGWDEVILDIDRPGVYEVELRAAVLPDGKLSGRFVVTELPAPSHAPPAGPGTAGPTRAGNAVGAANAASRAGAAREADPRYVVEGALALTGISFVSPLVAAGPVGPLDLEYDFVLTASAENVTVQRGSLVANDVAMDFVPAWDSGTRTLRLALGLPDTPADALRAAVPQAIVGPLDDLVLDGTFGWDLDLTVPVDAVSGMTWESHPRLSGFAVLRTGAGVNPYRLNDEFLHVIEDPGVPYRRVIRIPETRLPSLAWTLRYSEHTARQITRWREREAAVAARVAQRPPLVVGVDAVAADEAAAARPGDELTSADPAYRYVRLEEMSRWVVPAVLTVEDGDFFFYPGVNFYTLPRALERNLEAGEVLFGASTISMQLAKMLFLDQERTIARKLQEVFLVYLMEHEVPVAKERILELYLNVAEFGPGVFGIHDAAQRYFRKHPADLTAGEAMWIASILPSPKRFYAYYEAGAITPGWFVRMRSYFDIMLERGRMNAEEHRAASAAAPRFRY